MGFGQEPATLRAAEAAAQGAASTGLGLRLAGLAVLLLRATALALLLAPLVLVATLLFR